ncbi:hypothetical protein LTR37_019340 [Vermiconidia calcicola]|uniref:Uncharacterized protein n=1 Tax=Vermiconidia calcicola TaxID=1690605 RepID=A0ACC3MFV5_9PEZI|nr:hypothetical protein LTR37_019340 [Vermiconidia calcicola]
MARRGNAARESPSSSILTETLEDVLITQKHSHLLRLPGEVRNHIYELAAKDVKELEVNVDGTIPGHPLSQVCRQTRAEFRQWAIDEGFSQATKINVRLENFGHIAGNLDLMALLRGFPAPAEDIQRTLVLRVLLTNDFPNHKDQVRMLIYQSQPTDLDNSLPEYRLEIHWDPNTFDEQACRDVLAELRASYRSTYQGTQQPLNKYVRVERSFKNAFQRYSGQRKRKRDAYVKCFGGRKKRQVRSSSSD